MSDEIGERKSRSELPNAIRSSKRVFTWKRILRRKLEWKPKLGHVKLNPFYGEVRKPTFPKPKLDPLSERRRRQSLISASPNVTELNSRRVQERHATADVAKPEAPMTVICTVIRSPKRPGWHWEKFKFVAVPARGDKVILGYDPDVYFVRSVMHVAVEAGSGPPSIHIRVRTKRKKKKC